MNKKSIEEKFIKIQESYESGKITDKEYATLINSLNIETVISDNASELKKKHQLYDAMIKASIIAKTII